MAIRTCLAATVLLHLLGFPAAAESWEAIHEELRHVLAQAASWYFPPAGAAAAHPATASPAVPLPPGPWMITVGFTGGVEPGHGKASGIAAMNRRLHDRFAEPGGVLPLSFNNFHWRQAARTVTDLIEAGRRTGEWDALARRQPLIVAYGHSWGAGSVSKFARQLAKDGLELTLAVYVDAFSWRNPRVPANVRYAVNFYQRAGLLRGFPMRGKSKLVPADPASTEVLGNYRIRPEAQHWGWSWNLLQPLLYRQHHRIAHDARLQAYLLGITNLQLSLLSQTVAQASAAPGLFDRVVILGASVSAGEKAPSPGSILARHLGTPEDGILVFAQGGAESDRHLGSLDDIERRRPTLIVALDLFYHDFKFSLFLSESKKRYLRDYIGRLHRTGAVVVLGNIPDQVLLRHDHVNEYLLKIAPHFPRLILVDVHELVRKLDQEGLPVLIDGKRVILRKDDLFADRVHPNVLGNTVMANLILERLRAEFPQRLPPDPRPVPIPPQWLPGGAHSGR